MAQTYNDTNVNSLTINMLNKTEYNNLPQVSNTELYLVEEQIDDTPTENSANPVSSGGVYEALQNIDYDNIPIEFAQASSVDNVASGDTLAEMFGKLQKQYNTPSRKYNGNYVTNGDKLVLTMSANDIPYGTSATFIISGWGNTASLDILVVKHGDTWYSSLARIDSNWQSIDVNSTTVADNVVTVKLDVTTSSSNKFTINPVSGVRFNVSVE